MNFNDNYLDNTAVFVITLKGVIMFMVMYITVSTRFRFAGACYAKSTTDEKFEPPRCSGILLIIFPLFRSVGLLRSSRVSILLRTVSFVAVHRENEN